MSHIYDLIIIGSRPAGLAATAYAQRVELGTLAVEKAMVNGGQVLTTYKMDNYPGLPGIDGYGLGIKFREYAGRLGVRFVEDEVLSIRDGGKDAIEGVVCQGNTYEARSLILVTEAVHGRLGVPGEEELAGAGVSCYVTYDGASFHSKVTTIIEGDDVTVEGVIFLARICNKVYLIHRGNKLWAAKSLQENLLSLDNVGVIWGTVANSINGDGMVESLSLTSVRNGQKRELNVQGAFITVGIAPESRALEGLVDMNHGYIRTGKDTVTSVPGIFAADDVRTRPLRQVITTAAGGVNAITNARRYLVEN